MFIPVVKEDFVKVGKRFNGEAIINEVDRVFPLATADIAVLAPRGCGQSLLDKLANFRERLLAEVAMRRHFDGAKQGARASEKDAMKEGKLVLRSGVSLAFAAINRRQTPAGESPQETREVISGLTGRIRSLSGRYYGDSAAVRSRIETLKSILELPDFAPDPAEQKDRAKFVKKLEAVSAKLLDLAEAKKSMKEGTKDNTVALAELNGQTYSVLKVLTQVGKAAFREQGDPMHAAMYNLGAFQRKRAPNQAPANPVPQPSSPEPSNSVTHPAGSSTAQSPPVPNVVPALPS